MATTEIKDIRKTGPQSYRDLQKQNSQQFRGVDSTNPFLKMKDPYSFKRSTDFIYEGGEHSPLQQLGEDYWGRSQYDNPTANEEEYQASNLGDTRYENQAWYDTLANGVGKMLGTAGTTFVSSLVGLPYGLFQAANQGRWSALWDNEVTKGLADVDNWLEQNMTNYRSQIQQNSPWYDPNNLFSMNFIADDIIKNAGFTLGAAASMAVGSGAMGLMARSMNFVNNISNAGRVTNNVLSALFSATGEGMIEARQGVEERNKLEMQKLDDALAPELEALRMEFDEINNEYAANRNKTLLRGADGNIYDPAYETYKLKMQDLETRKDALQQKRKAGRQQIEESGLEMGNMILGANQVLLTAGNLIQFSKGMTKSFDKARHAAELSSKMTNPALVGTEILADGTYKVIGKNAGRTLAALKGIFTEGSEEMNQQWIQSSSGAASNREDVNDYWKAKMDRDAYNETTNGLYDLGQILDRGFQESWGDKNQWEQFVIGGLTGMAGSYSPTKLFNQDKTKSIWNPMRYGSWEGGAYNEIQDFNRRYNQYMENIEEVNKILQSEDFPARMSSLVGHTYTEREKEYLAEQNDKKGWKDADDKQAIHDIQAFFRAGKLDDLRAIYEEMDGQLSDEDIEGLIKATTREVTKEEDKQQYDSGIDEQIATHQRRISALKQKAQNIADQQDSMSPNERLDYQNAVTPALEGIFADIDKEYDIISNLEHQKDSYGGQKRYEGAYVDVEGNKIATYDEIRAEHKHNADELSRKLDSYLESIEAVNKMTNGRLTKDQEDNLAYLHNMSREKIVRFDKIMAKVRKQLPSKFLIKTAKTPEQLAQENASSDLSFSRDENTPQGYVEVDTSMMNDKAFGNFFMNTVMYGDNLMPETAQEGEEKTAKQEEKEKKAEQDRDEQQRINVERYKKNFYDTMRQSTNMTLEEIRNAFNELRQDIYDASVLQNDSQEFWNTYMEYMINPNKVDQAKEKEEKKVSEEQQKKDIQEMSVRDLAQRTDLKELLAQAKADSDIPMINKIKKAMLIRQQKAQTSGAERDTSVLSSYSPEDKELAIKIQMAKLDQELDRMEDSNDMESTLQELTDRIRGVDVQTVDDIILDNMNPVEKARLMQLEQDDPDAFEKEMAERENKVLQALDALEAHTLQNLPDFDETKVEVSDKDLADLADRINEENPEGPAEPKRHDEVNPVISVPVFPSEAPTGIDSSNNSVSDASVLDQDMKQGMGGTIFARSGQHPWRAVTRRVGYKTNEPYSQTLEKMLSETTDETKRKQLQKQLQRVKAVEKVLEEQGAFSRVEQGKVSRNAVIRFAVSKAVNDEAGDFVIFMTDINGVILADLPSSDIDIEPNTNQIPGLADLYEEARKQWDSLTDEEKDVAGFFLLDGLQTKVDYTYFGKVRYQDERQSVNDLFGDEEFTLALKIRGAKDSDSEPRIAVVAGKKALQGQVDEKTILQPRTGNVGQPYILIPTSKSGKKVRGESYIAVPILTPTFGELNPDSQFYRVVRNILKNIRDGKTSSKDAKELLNTLFGVDNIHINFDDELSKKGTGITLTTFSRNNQSEKGNSHDIFKGNREDLDVDAVLEAFGRFYVNISNKKINSSEPFYTLPNGEKVNYNRMVGEIATTNAAMPHTVNDFFTVVPLENKDGKFQQVEEKPARMKFPQGSLDSLFHVQVKYKDGTQRTWTIDPSENFVCRDEQGRPIYKEDNVHTASEKKLAVQYRAEAFGRFYMKDFSKPFVVMIDDKAFLYDPINKTFKTAQELEKTAPRYTKSLSEYDRLEDMLASMEEARLEAEETRLAAEATKNEKKEETIRRVEATITKLQDDGGKYVVCDIEGNPDPNGDYYKDDVGLLHARVTSMAEGDPYVEPFKETLEDGTQNPWVIPSTTIGNQVDEFIRVFFEGGDPMNLNLPNISIESQEKLLEDLNKIQEQITKQGWKVASRNIVASGVLGVTDANGDQIIVRVAGTLDLLLYNPEKDEYAIYDIKTHRKAIDFNNLDADPHMGKWSAQLSLYKEMLEAKYPELKGKIKGLKILPIKVSSDSYDADKHKYSVQEGVLFDENNNQVEGKVAYDGQTIPIKERSLNINMGKKGFKAEYNEEGKKQIIVSKPRALPGEASKQKVKEGILQTINKVAADRPMKRYLKDIYKENPEAVALCATLDEARKNGTLADLMLTEATMNMLSDMLNENLINNHAAQHAMNLEGLQIPGENKKPRENMPEVAEGNTSSNPVISGENPEEKAKQRKILDSTTEKAWNRLTEENKKRVANAANVVQVKKALQDAQRNPRKDPNQLISPYLHRKAVDTRGYKKLDINKELEWLNKVLPQLSRLNKVRIIQGLIRCSDGTWDYGQLKNGLMYLGTNGKEGTVYHEAFHAVTQWVLTDKELDDLYEAARERYGNLDTVTLEEKLADDFMLYTMGVKSSYKPKHQSIFRTLWNTIKKLFGHTSMIDKLYQNINDGVYAEAVLRTNENEFADITAEDREASMKYQFLDSDQRDRLKEGGVSRDQYEVLDSNEKRYLFHCVL